jgi:hypothetical protein
MKSIQFDAIEDGLVGLKHCLEDVLDLGFFKSCSVVDQDGVKFFLDWS